MIRIFIADDHKIIRQGLKQVLLSEKEIQIVGETDNGFELLNNLGKLRFDIIILDLNLPGKSGFELIREIKRHRPKACILIHSTFPMEICAIRAMKLGAAGYIAKDCSTDELKRAVYTISKRGKYINEKLADLLIDEFDNSRISLPHENLSDKEFQVMYMLAVGKSYAQIAQALNIHNGTVSMYVCRILDKMKLRTNSELIRYAIDKHIIN